MKPIISIRYTKTIRYYMQILSITTIGIFFLSLIIVSLSEGGFVLMLFVFIQIYFLYLILSFKEILLFKDITMVNGILYKTEFIKFDFYSCGRLPFKFCDVSYFDQLICKYIHSSMIMGRITNTNPKIILETIEKLQNGIDIIEPIDHSPNLEEDKSSCRILLLMLLILLLCSIPLVLIQNII